jgi:hypothetical protein
VSYAKVSSLGGWWPLSWWAPPAAWRYFDARDPAGVLQERQGPFKMTAASADEVFLDLREKWWNATVGQFRWTGSYWSQEK